jgi:hypothetical protein
MKPAWALLLAALVPASAAAAELKYPNLYGVYLLQGYCFGQPVLSCNARGCISGFSISTGIVGRQLAKDGKTLLDHVLCRDWLCENLDTGERYDPRDGQVLRGPVPGDIDNNIDFNAAAKIFCPKQQPLSDDFKQGLR